MGDAVPAKNNPTSRGFSPANTDHLPDLFEYASLGFDVSLQETLYALASGSVLFVIDQENRYDMSFLADFVHENRIDMLTMPFSALNLFFKEEKTMNNDHLRHVVTSGEAPRMTPEPRDYLEKNPRVSMHNQYGPTETHVATAHTFSATDAVAEYPPVGRPVSNTDVYILDPMHRPVPVGVQGEICIGGGVPGLGLFESAGLDRGEIHPPSLRSNTEDV